MRRRTLAPAQVGGRTAPGRGGSLRRVSASVAAVRDHMQARLRTVHRCAAPPAAGRAAGPGGATDLLLASVGEGEDVRRRTLRTLGYVRQRSLTDYLG